MFLCSWSGLVSPLLFLFIVCFDLMLTPEVAVEHLSVSPRPSSWARVEARPESSVLAKLENKNYNSALFVRIVFLYDDDQARPTWRLGRSPAFSPGCGTK